MRERLVEDWLIRINERGYDVAFCQILLSQGRRILRVGHSPTEHGKDVLAVSSDGHIVWGYQLKTGTFSQADVTKHLQQLQMLVEARPTFPGLPASFDYRPVLVTTGDFKEPAISLIKELNESWRVRKLPTLEVINGRSLLADLLALSEDFWPVALPDIRTLRSLFLVEGRGDFDAERFSELLMRLFEAKAAEKNVGRQAAAANLYTSYLLGPFQENADHWSVFRGWTICAASIAWAGAKHAHPERAWMEPFTLAREAALVALRALHAEARDENQFRPAGIELDDYTRVRNVTALSAAACAELVGAASEPDVFRGRLKQFIEDDRLSFWGEGALSQYLMLIWFLGRHRDHESANELLLQLIELVTKRNSTNSGDPLLDVYTSADECLMRMLSDVEDTAERKAIESHCLFPLIVLCARRNLRKELASLWPAITHVRMSWFRTDDPLDVLQWRADAATEYSQQFGEYSWKELREFALRQDHDRVPPILWKDTRFALMYLLTFQHRTMASLIKRVDEGLIQQCEVCN